MSAMATGIMLVNGRHAMVARAVQSFIAQDYPNKYLLIWDTGEPKYAPPFVYDPHGIEVWHRKAGATVGELRNDAIAESRGEIIVTFDSDDVSHSRRISEQVALLEASGADAVGFSDLLFWDSRTSEEKAWLYTRPTKLNVPGATLAFKRKTWERKPFPHLPEVGNPTSQGEDIVWQAGLKVVAISSVREFVHLHPEGTFAGVWDQSAEHDDTEPRMIASVHSGNTMAAGYSHIGHVEEFVRVPPWDDYCRRVMEIK